MRVATRILPSRVRTRIQGYRWANLRRRRDLFLTELKNRRSVVVLGTQKSGTTAIAALMASAAGVPATLDLQNAIRDTGWQLRLQYRLEDLSDFIWTHREDFERAVIKEPSLTYIYPSLRTLMPNSHFVFVIRNPFSTIRSTLNRLKIPGDLTALDFDDWPELRTTPIWRSSLDSTWLGRPSDHYIAALAHRWDIAAEMALGASDKAEVIKYEDFTSDKAGFIRALCQKVGLASNHNIADLVDKPFQRTGNPDVDPLSFFGPENYQTIARITTRNAEKLCYSIPERS